MGFTRRFVMAWREGNVRPTRNELLVELFRELHDVAFPGHPASFSLYKPAWRATVETMDLGLKYYTELLMLRPRLSRAFIFIGSRANQANCDSVNYHTSSTSQKKNVEISTSSPRSIARYPWPPWATGRRRRARVCMRPVLPGHRLSIGEQCFVVEQINWS